MKHPKSNRITLPDYLLNAYEAMSREGKVFFLGESDFLDLIEHYQHEQPAGKMLEVINHALQQYPTVVSFYTAKARYYLHSEEIPLAKAILRKALIFSPCDFEIHLLLAETFGRLNQFEQAYKAIRYLKCLADGRDLARVYVCEATVLQLEKRYAEQFNSLKKALQIDPGIDAALDQIWWCMECTGRYVETALIHEQILENNAFHAKAWLNAGKAYDALGKTEEAIEALEFAFFLDERLEMAYRDAAELLIATRQFRRALVTLQEALGLFQADALYFYQMALCHEMLGERTKAKSYYLKALNMQPEMETVLFRLGECYSKDREWKTALYFYHKAIACGEEEADCYQAMEKAYSQCGNFAAADACFEKAVLADPLSPDIWIQHILLLLDRGDSEAAFETLEAAHLNSGDDKLLYCHAACYYRTGDHYNALEQLGEALMSDYSLHPCLFDMCPEMDFDDKVQGLIGLYGHEDGCNGLA